MSSHTSYQRFFAELERRRVFRVMAVYGVVAFGVLQVADIAFPRLGMPEGLKRTEDAAEHELSAVVRGPEAVRNSVNAHASQVAQLDSVEAAYMVGYVAAVLGDEEGARAAIGNDPRFQALMERFPPYYVPAD